MNLRNRDTGQLIHVIATAFNIEQQLFYDVFVELETGRTFCLPQEVLAEKYVPAEEIAYPIKNDNFHDIDEEEEDVASEYDEET